jgi:hypothetical protein
VALGELVARVDGLERVIDPVGNYADFGRSEGSELLNSATRSLAWDNESVTVSKRINLKLFAKGNGKLSAPATRAHPLWVRQPEQVMDGRDRGHMKAQWQKAAGCVK